MSQPSSWRQFSVSCGVALMASAAVLWFGDEMSAVPLRNNKAAASAVRTVTVLGATGSIGDSTMDLLRGARERYRVEALTANGNVQALAKLAKEFDARFAAVADPARLSELKEALGRDAHRMRRRRKRHHRSGRASRRLGDGRDQRRSRAETGARRGRPRRGGGAREQGVPGLRRRLLHAARGQSRGLHPAGGFRAQRAVSGAEFRQPRGTGSRHHHRLRRTRSAPGRLPTSSRRRWRRR